MSTEHQQRINEFMVKAKQELPDKPTIPSLQVRILRAKLIIEEALELINGGLGIGLVFKSSSTFADIDDIEFYENASIEPNLELIADGCADLSVVNIGTLSACGINDKPLLELVDQNNLDKFGPGHSWREDGKLIKPPNHTAPDIKSELIRQGWEE